MRPAILGNSVAGIAAQARPWGLYHEARRSGPIVVPAAALYGGRLGQPPFRDRCAHRGSDVPAKQREQSQILFVVSSCKLDG